jgi:hypothetical protein
MIGIPKRPADQRTGDSSQHGSQGGTADGWSETTGLRLPEPVTQRIHEGAKSNAPNGTSDQQPPFPVGGLNLLDRGVRRFPRGGQGASQEQRRRAGPTHEAADGLGGRRLGDQQQGEHDEYQAKQEDLCWRGQAAPG